MLLGEARGLTKGPPTEAGLDLGDPDNESRRLAKGRIREDVCLSDIKLLMQYNAKRVRNIRFYQRVG